jgi:hypothetical protein
MSLMSGKLNVAYFRTCGQESGMPSVKCGWIPRFRRPWSRGRQGEAHVS